MIQAVLSKWEDASDEQLGKPSPHGAVFRVFKSFCICCHSQRSLMEYRVKGRERESSLLLKTLQSTLPLTVHQVVDLVVIHLLTQRRG